MLPPSETDAAEVAEPPTLSKLPPDAIIELDAIFRNSDRGAAVRILIRLFLLILFLGFVRALLANPDCRRVFQKYDCDRAGAGVWCRLPWDRRDPHA